MRYNLVTMDVYLGHLKHRIQSLLASTAMRPIQDDAQTAGKRTSCHRPERVSAVCLPVRTVHWLYQQAEAQGCTMTGIVGTPIAGRAISGLTALYQQHIASPAEFSAALWSVLGYEPEPSPGEEISRST